jgi:hypothetical protein
VRGGGCSHSPLHKMTRGHAQSAKHPTRDSRSTRDGTDQREGANTMMRGPRSIPKATARLPTPDTRSAPNISLPIVGGTTSSRSLTGTIGQRARLRQRMRPTGHARTDRGSGRVASVARRVRGACQANSRMRFRTRGRAPRGRCSVRPCGGCQEAERDGCA